MPVTFIVQYLKSAAVVAAMMAAVVSPTLDAAVVLCKGDDGHVGMEFAHADGACDVEQLHREQGHAHDAELICPTPHQCVDKTMVVNIAVDSTPVRSIRYSIEASYPITTVGLPQRDANRAMWNAAARSSPPSLRVSTITVLLI